MAIARFHVDARQPAWQLAGRTRALAADQARWEAAAAAAAAEEAARELLAGRTPAAATLQVVQQALLRAADEARVPGRTVERRRGLLVSADTALAGRFRDVAAREGFVDMVASTPEEAVAQVAGTSPRFLVVDASTDRTCGAVRKLARAPEVRGVPFAVVTDASSTAACVAALHAGATLTLPTPCTSAHLLAAVRELDAPAADAPVVLVVDDDPASGEETFAALEAEGLRAVLLIDPFDLVAELGRIRPDALLLRDPLPLCGTADLCRLVRSTPAWNALPLVVRADGSGARRALLAAGADVVVDDAGDLAEAALLVRTRTRARNRALRGSLRDAETGLLASAAFADAATAGLLAAKRAWRHAWLLLVELPDLDAIADMYGASAALRAVGAVGALLDGHLRAEDPRGRWTRGRFAVFLGHGDEAGAKVVADRLARALADLEVEGERGERFAPGFLMGAAAMPDDGTTVAALIDVATRRLREIPAPPPVAAAPRRIAGA